MILNEAIKEILKNKTAKFDETVEVHVNLSIDPKKQDQVVRFVTTLPNGTGKSKKVAVLAIKKSENADLNLTENDIDKIIDGTIKPGVDFDVIVTEPSFMPKIARAAKILGPQGVMPNPKNGTVTEDIDNTVAEIKKGQIEIKNEKEAPLVHSVIGKSSFGEKKLAENLTHFITALKKNKAQKAPIDWIKKITICTTMGNSVIVDFDL